MDNILSICGLVMCTISFVIIPIGFFVWLEKPNSGNMLRVGICLFVLGSALTLFK